MKQIQKRYFYSAFISALFFIICYGILDFNLWFILLLTLIFFVGGTFFFKEKDIRSYDPKILMNYYFIASKISNFSNQITEPTIKDNINLITDYTDQILISLEQRPKKVEQVYDFFDYYLDLTYKLLWQYNSLIGKEQSVKEKQFFKKVNGYLKNIANLFANQLKNMHEAKMIDINTQIKIFKKTLDIDLENLAIKEGEDNEG